MKKSTLLLLVSMLGLVLVAPPAYSQKTQDQLNQLMADSIALRATVKQLQDSFDQKNAETNKLLQEILTRFTTLDSSVKTLNESLTTVSTSVKTTDEKAARDLDLGRHFGDQLGRECDDLLFVESLRLEVAVDRLGEDLYRTGFSFSVIHKGLPVRRSTGCATTHADLSG